MWRGFNSGRITFRHVVFKSERRESSRGSLRSRVVCQRGASSANCLQHEVRAVGYIPTDCGLASKDRSLWLRSRQHAHTRRDDT